MTPAAILAVIFSGIVAIILVSGLVKWGNARAAHRSDAGLTGMDEEVLERLALIERRLTDTQDVMLALSDKLDRWDHEVPVGVQSMGDTLDKGR